MKRRMLWIWCCMLGVGLVASQAQGIGISPARWTADITDYDPSFNRTHSYLLIKGSTRYTSFSALSPMGLTGTVTGASTSVGVEYVGDSAIIIDWDVADTYWQDGYEVVSASIQVTSPNPWICPVEAGGGRYLDNLVRHTDVVDPASGIGGVASAISQIAFYRNYAPRAYILGIQEPAEAGQSFTIDLQLEDKNSVWSSENSNNLWFSYEVDWDGDGLADQSGGVSFDEEPTPHSKYPTVSSWTSGIQVGSLTLDHIYDTGGSHVATLMVTDNRRGPETTTLQIPIQVTPEPATMSLLALGGLCLVRRRR